MKRHALPDVLRERLRRDRRSLYAIADVCDIPRGALSRFQRGQRDLTLATAARLCAALDLELRPARRPKRKGR